MGIVCEMIKIGNNMVEIWWKNESNNVEINLNRKFNNSFK